MAKRETRYGYARGLMTFLQIVTVLGIAGGALGILLAPLAGLLMIIGAVAWLAFLALGEALLDIADATQDMAARFVEAPPSPPVAPVVRVPKDTGPADPWAEKIR